jgi:chorismate mutase/prephenate dehydratase
MTGSGEPADAEAARGRIDEIDRQLVALLNERARVSQDAAALAGEQGAPAFAPEREAQVFRNVEAANQGPLSNSALRDVWAEVLSASRALQRPLRVGYLGPAGSFSEDATRARFGRSVEYVPFPTIPEAIHAAARREVDLAVAPVENSIDGGVDFALDTLVEADVRACAEILLPVAQHLASAAPSLADVKKVYSQAVALGQCRGWLARNLPGVEIAQVDSTARAVALGKEPGAAGIGSESAATLNGVPILARNIHDYANNVTRFLVLSDHIGRPTGKDKTGLVFSVRHEAGALHRALGVLADRGLNMTRIESRPVKRQAWQYVFFVDVQGHEADPPVQAAIEDLRHHAPFLKVLGSWPEETPANGSARSAE